MRSRQVAALRPVLVGDNIENPGNVETLQKVAALFDWDCQFLDGECELARHALTAACAPIIALENTEDAEDLYGFQPPPGARLALIVGNERKGITRAMLDCAYQKVRIPVASRQINTVNVAAAAAIALYFLSHGGRGRLRLRPDPNRSRPELLIAGPTDPIELGSVIRSAAAFGWERILVEDRHEVWFETDRVTRSLGRGAARRGRNDIHVIPHDRSRHEFQEACIVTADGDGEAIDRAELCRGPGQLIVLPDESGALPSERELLKIARRVRRLSLGLPAAQACYKFRSLASIALAEVARQVGARQRTQTRRSAARHDAEETGFF